MCIVCTLNYFVGDFVLCLSKVDIDSAMNDIKDEHVQVEETDDSCRFEFFEIVPLARCTDGSSATECVSGDWSAEVKQENLTVVKHEPDDV